MHDALSSRRMGSGGTRLSGTGAAGRPPASVQAKP